MIQPCGIQEIAVNIQVSLFDQWIFLCQFDEWN